MLAYVQIISVDGRTYIVEEARFERDNIQWLSQCAVSTPIY
jgi:hypothetical protein